ncbi:YcbK family protein [Anaeromicrobium sediminis]|uniref:Murein endopeptidase K n=1 Tax=Anaeromicrobium sediminis TaxID=1478221 RepID=A0A267MNY9_9FIRM|nr:D-Ala-D-Ala carboxypeptidase family metallohydrolase [Anaeromicrobium sediminis]PAB61311.1 hypothetical protein CCE28_02445 [Anaeromicrobium sediminis]
MYQVTKNFNLSDNFKIGEFACHDSKKSVVVDRHLVKKLEELRTACGNKSITITSGYRSKEYNDALIKKGLKASPKSNHMLGCAADIKISGMKPEEVAKKAIEVGFRGIGVYDTFTHVDVRYELVNGVQRAYDYWDMRK